MTKDTALLFLCVIVLAEAASAQTTSPAPTMELIVLRMAQARSANEKRFRPYTVTREYMLFGRGSQNAKSQIIADVSFIPPGQKSFSIRQSWGAGMGEKVVRRMLTSESELANKDTSDVSSANYEFRLLGQESYDGRRCYVLQLLPRRKDTNLMVGKAWVDAQTYLVHRVEGEPAQKPSWWVRNLHFALSYGNIRGMWLPTGVEATAEVRIIGECRLVSHNVGISTGQSAANQQPQMPPRRRIDRRN